MQAKRNLGYIVFFLIFLLISTGCETTPDQVEEPTSNSDKAAEINAELGLAYLNEGNIEAAKKKLKKAYRQNPDSIIVQTGLGILHERLDDFKAAEKYYKKAVDLEGSNRAGTAHNNYARYLCKKKEYDNADKLFRLAYENKMYKSRELPITNAGVCLLEQGKTKKAKEYFRNALKVNNKFGPALIQMCKISYNEGVIKLSKSYLDRYMYGNQKTLEAIFLGYQIEKKLGNDIEKRKYAGLLKRNYPDSEETAKVYADEE